MHFPALYISKYQTNLDLRTLTAPLPHARTRALPAQPQRTPPGQAGGDGAETSAAALPKSPGDRFPSSAWAPGRHLSPNGVEQRPDAQRRAPLPIAGFRQRRG